jgi:thiamine biosynthesis lipoprotein
MMGTWVSIQIAAADPLLDAGTAMRSAFERMSHIARVMSAHESESDLGRLSRAQPGEVISLDPHTVTVLRAAQYWNRRSGGAFNPAVAGWRLARQGVRPGLNATCPAPATLADVEFVSSQGVRLPSSLCLDVGGIAKGYAVDQAAECLLRHGVTSALINAGGDLRVVGRPAWRVEVRHSDLQLRDRVWGEGLRLSEGAVATSSTIPPDTQFVPTTGRRGRAWRNATVQAPDCMTADVLTKWAMQSTRLCPSLKSALREHRARMWRS